MVMVYGQEDCYLFAISFPSECNTGMRNVFLYHLNSGIELSPGGGNFNRRVTGLCHLTSEIAP